MIPKNLNEELHSILSPNEIEARKITKDNFNYVEFHHDKDVSLIEKMGIEVDELGPLLVIFMWYELNQIELGGYLVVDNLSVGRPSLGGIRFNSDITVREVASLARGMTLKNAAAGLPFGGGKAGIIAPRNMNAKERQQVIETFARLIFRYKDIYNPGPDVGTNDEDMKTIAIFNGIDNVVSKTVDMGGNRIDMLGGAAGGVVVAIDEIYNQFYKLRELPQFKGYPIKPLDESSMIIQGFGAVGSNVAKLFAEGELLTNGKKAPRITGVSDYDGYIYSDKGLDIYELLRTKREGNIVSWPYYKFNKKPYLAKGDTKFSNARDDLLKHSADILVPASQISNYIGIDDRFNPSVNLSEAGHWTIIVEGANTLSLQKERILERRKLEKILYRERGTLIATDFLVNAGGVIFAACEKLIPTPEHLTVPLNLRGNRDEIEKWLETHRDEFVKLAEERKKLAEAKRNAVIRENMGIFIDHLIKDENRLPCDVAKKISLERIIRRDRFVNDVMRTDIPQVSPDTPIKELAKILVERNLDFLPVIGKDKKLVGVVTDWDVTRAVLQHELNENTVSQIMTPREKVVTATSRDEIMTTANSLNNHQLSAFPVVDEEDKVLGVISSDLLVQKTLLRLLNW